MTVFKENFLSDLTDKKSYAQVRICNTPCRLEMCLRAVLNLEGEKINSLSSVSMHVDSNPNMSVLRRT